MTDSDDPNLDRRSLLGLATGVAAGAALGPAAPSFARNASATARPTGIVMLDAVTLADAIRSRQVSCVEVMTAYLDHIETLNPQVNAIVALAGPRGVCWRRRASAMRRSHAASLMGPLHGFPLAVKDLEPVKGIRMTMGSPIFKDFVPARGQHHGGAAAQGRRDLHRQDQYAGIRLGLAHLQSGLWRHPQRLRPISLGRRQQRRRRGLAGAAHAAGRGRQRLSAAACAIRPAGTTSSAFAPASASCRRRARCVRCRP